MHRFALVALAVLLLAACGGPDQTTRDQAITEAKQAFEEAQEEGLDLREGPCIAEELNGLPEWVADVAHDPRVDVDDEPANQCQRYRDGEADHFVELTPEGELIRAE